MCDRELYCDICGDVRRFEQPPCLDGHDDDCPELACTTCGHALLVASWLGGSAGQLGLDDGRRAASAARRSGHVAA